MDDRRSMMMLNNLTVRKQALQDKTNSKREDISEIEDEIGRLGEQIQKIDSDIDKVRSRADAEAQKEEPMDNGEGGLGTEEADAATTTASLDASSSGGLGGGAGWRHYSKVGPTITRFSGKKKKKKNKRDKILSYINKVFDPDSAVDGDGGGDF